MKNGLTYLKFQFLYFALYFIPDYMAQRTKLITRIFATVRLNLMSHLEMLLNG